MTQPVPHVFEHRSFVPVSADRAWALYQDPRILFKLTPPPIFVRVHRDERRALDDGELEFTLWFGPLPVRWHTRHEKGPLPTSFVDRMLDGPLDTWIHEHLVEPVEDGAVLVDRITIAHRAAGPWSLFTRLMFDGLPLRVLFLYRHWMSRELLLNPRRAERLPLVAGAALAGVASLAALALRRGRR